MEEKIIHLNASCSAEIYNGNLKNTLWEIWASGFEDSREYFDMFWRGKVLPGKAEIFCLEGYGKNTCSKIKGAAYLLKAENAYYGYAFSILPEYRGHGLYKIFAQSLCSFAQKDNKGIIFLPANKKLSDYYEKTGAKKNFIRRIYIISSDAYEDIILHGKIRYLTESDGALCRSLYENYAPRNHLKWDSYDIMYAIRENEKCGGSGILFNFQNSMHFAFVKKSQDSCFAVTDTSLPFKIFTDIAGSGKYKKIKTLKSSLLTYNIPYLKNAAADFLLD